MAEAIGYDNTEEMLMSVFPLTEGASRLTCLPLTDTTTAGVGDRLFSTIEDLALALSAALGLEAASQIVETRSAGEISQITIARDFAHRLGLTPAKTES